MDVLAPLSAAAQKSASALARFGEHFTARLKQQSETITDKKQREINTINIDADRFRKFKGKLDDSLDVVSNTITRTEGLRSQLNGLILTVNNAQADPKADEGAEGYRLAFNSILNQMRDVAGKARVSTNLLGNDGSLGLRYPSDPSGTAQTLRGINLVNDYYIIDSEGKHFKPERTLNLIRQQSHDPEAPSDVPTENYANLDTGVRLDRLSGQAINFTLKPGNAGKTRFSGTLVREGPGILDPWLYDNFATPEGRNRALADLEAAKSVLDFEIRRYGAAKSTIEYQRNQANSKIKQADFAIEDISIEQAQSIRLVKAGMARESAVLASSLEHAQLIRREYTKIFGGNNNPLIKNLLDISV